jgi:hypothetical protein
VIFTDLVFFTGSIDEESSVFFRLLISTYKCLEDNILPYRLGYAMRKVAENDPVYELFNKFDGDVSGYYNATYEP